MNMKRALCILSALAMVMAAGCEDSPTDPTNQPIVAEWTSTRVGEAFAPATEVELHFESDGSMHGSLGSADIHGSYTTAGSSATSDIREITLNMSMPITMSFVGIYQVSSDGTTMQMEVVPDNDNDDITPPSVAGGFGSTKDNGSSAGNRYISDFTKM